MAKRKRNIVLRVSVTAEEWTLIDQKMKLLHTSNLSAYARKMLIDKEFVIRRHLIDELDFKRIEAEHIERWHEFGKSERTLRRYQKIALERIMR